MKLIPVISSCIAAVGYEPRAYVLGIKFTSGRFYHYFEVPRSIYERLLHASSHGTYFNDEIKDRYPLSIIR